MRPLSHTHSAQFVQVEDHILSFSGFLPAVGFHFCCLKYDKSVIYFVIASDAHYFTLRFKMASTPPMHDGNIIDFARAVFIITDIFTNALWLSGDGNVKDLRGLCR